jgi:hypothetical protein
MINESDYSVTSGNAPFRFKGITYLSRSEIRLFKNYSGEKITESSVYRRREPKYRAYDFNNA